MDFRCMKCMGELDTGFRCTQCGRSAMVTVETILRETTLPEWRELIEDAKAAGQSGPKGRRVAP